MEKRVLIVFIFVLLIGSVAVFNVNLKSIGYAILNVATCQDGTAYGQCSGNNGLYCDNGNLANNCSVCGCSNGFICSNNECLQANSCSDGNGICSNECNDGSIEYSPLTSSCNLEENNNGNIDITNSKQILINSYLKNANNFRIIEKINVNFYIQDTDIKEGYTLLALNPLEEYKQTIKLNLPDNLDRTKTYTLHTQVVYSDKTLSQDYSLSVNGGSFSLIINNATFANNQMITLGDDLLTNFEIINNKCCVKNSANIKRFFGYCSINNQCSDNKPLTCKNGLVIEDCTTCGCNNNYNCGNDGRCTLKISSEETQKFYDLNNININEQNIIGNFVRDFSRIPKSTEKPVVTISNNQLNVSIANITLEGKIINQSPEININLGKQ
jgi:hypothetical protein